MTIICLYSAYRSVITLRVKHLSLKKPPLDLYAVLVRDVALSFFPSKMPDGFVDSEFATRYGKTYNKSIVIPKLKKVTICDSSCVSIVQTEKKSGFNVVFNFFLQVQRAYDRYTDAKYKLQEAYNLLEWSKTPENPQGTRPMTLAYRTWPPFLYVDSIDFYSREVEQKFQALRDAQAHAIAYAQSAAAVAFFNDPTVASLAARAIPGINSALWTISPAPQPEDVEWESVTLPLWNRTLRMVLVFIVTWVTVIFYLVSLIFSCQI